MDPPQVRREIEILDRIAASDVSLGRHLEKTFSHGRHDVGVLRAKLVGEITRHGQIGDRRHSALGNRLGARFPHRGAFGPIRAGCVGEYEASEPIAVLERERLADHPAHREPDPVGLADAEAIEHAHGVVCHALERVRPLRHGTLAVAARVDAQHAEAARQHARELVPHAMVAADRVREQHGAAAAAAVDAMQLDRLHFLRFRLPLCEASSSAITWRASLKAWLAVGTPQ